MATTTTNRTGETRTRITNRFFKTADTLKEAVDKGADVRKLELMVFTFRGFKILSHYALSKDREKRLFAAENLGRFLNKYGEMHPVFMFGVEITKLVQDPDKDVRVAFCRNFVTGNNLVRYIKIINMICQNADADMLNAIREGAVETAKDNNYTQETREKGVEILLIVLTTSTMLKADEVKGDVASDLGGVESRYLEQPIGRFLTSVNASIEHCKQHPGAESELSYEEALIISTIAIVSRIKNLKGTEGLWAQLVTEQFLPAPVREEIAKMLISFGVPITMTIGTITPQA